MNGDRRNPLSRLLLTLSLAMLLTLAACGRTGAPVPQEPTPGAVEPTAVQATAKPAAVKAAAEEVSLSGLETMDQVLCHLDTVLPCQEELIPYAGDIYHAGENTLTFQLYGFCTRSGRIVTKPVFSAVSVVRAQRSDGSAAENLYLCTIPSAGGAMSQLYTLSGTRVEDGAYSFYPELSGLVYGPVLDVVDDGIYYLEGYSLDEAGYGVFSGHTSSRYEICRKSDGAGMAATEVPLGSWPGLCFINLRNGERLYYTLLGGICTTWDKDFSPLLEVPALGSRSAVAFERQPILSETTESAAAYPGEQGSPMGLSETQQYAANLSLSNFSEQHFCEGWDEYYDNTQATVAQLFRFAHHWAKINRPSALAYENNGAYETMTRESFFEIIAPRIDYPADLTPVEGDEYSAALGMGHYEWDHCWYENGRFYYPAGDGESYNRFTVVTEAYKINDGAYRFYFTIYELDLDIYWQESCVPDRYYRLGPGRAAQLADAGEITPMRSGMAVCSPVYWQGSGREMYCLEYYRVDPLD